VLKKTLLILAIVIAILITIVTVYIYSSGIDFSDEDVQRMEAAILAPLSKQVGTEGFARNGETTIWYDVHTPTDSLRGTVVLIMGLSADALAWPKFFIQGLTDAGYQVVRLDNRGVGMSDWDDFDPEEPYTLTDMSLDVLAVLDTLGIEKAHICGVSLGGMIGQTLCIEFPERALSLTSIMSTPDIMNPDLPKLKMMLLVRIAACAFRYRLVKSELNAIKFSLTTRSILMGPEKYELDIERIAQLTLYNLRHRNGANPLSGEQQTTAVEVSGSRVEALKTLQTPTLVVHGITDPLIPFEHGLKTAELVPNSETLWIDGMGHIIPEAYSDTIITRMIDMFGKTEM
jgi:pimeloyl-ACP methyl ester carboxylesterase